MIDTNDPLTLIRTYRDFRYYCDWLEEQGRDTKLLKSICHRFNYRTVLCFLYPKSVLKQFKLKLKVREENYCEGGTTEMKVQPARDIKELNLKYVNRAKGIIKFKFDDFIPKELVINPYWVLTNHNGIKVRRGSSNYYGCRKDERHAMVIFLSISGFTNYHNYDME